MDEIKIYKVLYLIKNGDGELTQERENLPYGIGENEYLRIHTQLEKSEYIEQTDDLIYTLTDAGNFELNRIKLKIDNDSLYKTLSSDKLKTELKLSKLQLKTYWIVLIFGLFGGLYSLVDLVSKGKDLINPVEQESKLKTDTSSKPKKSDYTLTIKNQDSLLLYKKDTPK